MSTDPDLSDSFQKALAFGRDRWCMRFRSRAHLEMWQQRRLAEFIRDTLPKAGRFRGLGKASLGELPYMDKTLMMSDFNGFNTRGITLKEATGVALHAEGTRNFKPLLGDLTVGMSSGTSGAPGVFLVSRAERQRWAGIALSRALPSHLLRALFTPWRAPLRIAFFLRANSNLYTTLHSRRLQFGFHDLLQPLEASFAALAAAPPDLLVAPASILKALAGARLEGRTTLQPDHVISVAEVLEPADAEFIERAFQRRPHQIYQSTEGFLGFTCEAGTLHLNEAHLHVEADWLDDTKTRFQPVITDFSRETQMIVRYRLNDILTPAGPCSCGRPEAAISAIAGRTDEVLLLPSLREQTPTRVFPDVLRHAMMLAGPALREYRVTQRGTVWDLDVQIVQEEAATLSRIRDSISALCQRLGAVPPQLQFGAWHPPAPGAKRQRINRLLLPHAP